MFFYSCSILIPLRDLPKPNGAYIVGTEVFYWEDFSRDEWFTKDKIDSRKIVVQIWYPAEAVSDSLYPYMDNASLRLEALSEQIGVPSFILKGTKKIKGNSYYKAKPILNSWEEKQINKKKEECKSWWNNYKDKLQTLIKNKINS